MPLAFAVALGSLLVAVYSDGNARPLPYVPLLNPTDLAVALGLAACAFWLTRIRNSELAVPAAARDTRWLLALAAIGFVAVNTVWLRVVHHYAGIPWDGSRLFASFLVQAGYSILWTLIALGLMVGSHRRGLRAAWMLGAGLLGLTVLKLFVIDLSNRGGSERIFVFIAVGVLMLVVGYFAPLPPVGRRAGDEALDGAQNMNRQQDAQVFHCWAPRSRCAPACVMPMTRRRGIRVARVARGCLPAPAWRAPSFRRRRCCGCKAAMHATCGCSMLPAKHCAFALMEPVRAAARAGCAEHTAAYPALPLFSLRVGARQPQGLDAGAHRRGRPAIGVGARWTAPMSPAHRSSIRSCSRPRTNSNCSAGSTCRSALPANTPVRMSASSSADLAQWTALPVRGRLYRFDGAGAPVNMTLEFERPVKLEGRYLRLDWSGQEGVSRQRRPGVVATTAQAAGASARRAAGAASGRIGRRGNHYRLSHADRRAGADHAQEPTPCCRCASSGATMRRSPGGCWRRPSSTGWAPAGNRSRSTRRVALHGASARWLRIESTNGADLATAQLQASAEFEPLRLVFVATGTGPFEIAAGRANTTPAALPLATIAGTLGTRKIEDLPTATVGAAVIQAKAGRVRWNGCGRRRGPEQENAALGGAAGRRVAAGGRGLVAAAAAEALARQRVNPSPGTAPALQADVRPLYVPTSARPIG